MSLRPQAGMKEGACIAAKGEEASILMWTIRVVALLGGVVGQPIEVISIPLQGDTIGDRNW